MATATFIGQGGKWRNTVTSLLDFSARRTSGLKIQALIRLKASATVKCTESTYLTL